MKIVQKDIFFFILTLTCHHASSMYNNTPMGHLVTQPMPTITTTNITIQQKTPLLSLANCSYSDKKKIPCNQSIRNNQIQLTDNISMALNNHLTQVGKYYCANPVINFCARLCSLAYYTIEDPYKELLALAPVLNNQLTSVTMVKQLQQKNAFFHDCLQQLRSSGASSHKNISPIAIDELPIPIKQYLTTQSDLFCKNNLGIHPIVFEKIIANNIKLTLFYTFPTNTNGYFDRTTLVSFLAQTFKEGKIDNPAFDSTINYLRAQNTGPQGGYNNQQLFLINSTNTQQETASYLIKESTIGIDEIVDLKQVASFPNIQNIIFPRRIPKLPSILLPTDYCAYSDTQTVHYLTIMPKAPGIALNVLINNFNKNQTLENRELLSNAFYILGQETAGFHKLSLIHGDFHFFHLFFNGDHFIWIDNTSMKKKKSPSVDIIKLFLMPFAAGNHFRQFYTIIKKIDLKLWHEISLKQFVMGYANTYSPHQKKTVYSEIKHMFNQPFYIPWVKFFEEDIDMLRKIHINPLFDELISSQ